MSFIILKSNLYSLGRPWLRWQSGSAYVRSFGSSIPAWRIVSWSLCPWARHFTHLALCECVWLLYVWGGWRACRRWTAATLPSVCPRAAVATLVVYHQYDCVWMNGTWNSVRRFGWLEKRHTNPIQSISLRKNGTTQDQKPPKIWEKGEF